jgi:hypothetical protein
VVSNKYFVCFYLFFYGVIAVLNKYLDDFESIFFILQLSGK